VIQRLAWRAPAGWWPSARLALGTASALGLARFAYGLLVPAMRTELHWSLAQAGVLTTANGLGYLLGAVATAPVARRLGVPGTFRLGMVLTAAALAATAVTGGSYPVLLLTRAAAGFTGALVFITGGVIASRAAATARSATPLTIYFSGAGLGVAFSGTVIPPLLGQHPGRWPLAWGVLAAAAGAATIVTWTAAHGGPDTARVETTGPVDTTAGVKTADAVEPTGAAAATMDLRGVARLWPVAVAYLLFAAGYIAYITFLSAYLAAHHASVAQVTLTWALLGLAAIAAPALWSRPIHTWPGAKALALSLAVLSAAAAVALVSAAPAVVTGSAIGYGATFLSVPAAITTLVRRAIPPRDLTGALAAFTVVFAAGQTAGPYLAGGLADHYGTGATLAWTAALCITGAALSVVIRSATLRPAGPPALI
jgi:predicted MFS family arabinose efflux permease